MLHETLSYSVIDAAMRVHSAVGPGLFEEVYKACLKHELIKAGLKTLSEVPIPVFYDGVALDIGYRVDLVVEDTLIIELKSIADFSPLHKAQLLTYLKVAKKEVGLLLNFNSVHLRDGIFRMVHSIPSHSTDNALSTFAPALSGERTLDR